MATFGIGCCGHGLPPFANVARREATGHVRTASPSRDRRRICCGAVLGGLSKCQLCYERSGDPCNSISLPRGASYNAVAKSIVPSGNPLRAKTVQPWPIRLTSPIIHLVHGMPRPRALPVQTAARTRKGFNPRHQRCGNGWPSPQSVGCPRYCRRDDGQRAPSSLARKANPPPRISTFPREG